MSRYDGLIIPRSYSEYINKTDAATLSAAIAQSMQLGGVSDAYPTANSTKIAQSGGIFKAAQILAADSTTITGAIISAGSIVRVFFTAAITGSDASTALVLTYNGVNITVKVNKNGELANFTAAGEDYTYLQAYTTLEMYYDGTNFVIIGNPVVISTTDYTIYTDGTKSDKNGLSYKLVNNVNDALISSDTGLISWCTTYQASNTPIYTSNYWCGFTIKFYASPFQIQVAFGLGSTKCYLRTYNGSWGSWSLLNS